MNLSNETYIEFRRFPIANDDIAATIVGEGTAPQMVSSSINLTRITR